MPNEADSVPARDYGHPMFESFGVPRPPTSGAVDSQPNGTTCTNLNKVSGDGSPKGIRAGQNGHPSPFTGGVAFYES